MTSESVVPWLDEGSWAEMRLSLLTAIENIEPRCQKVRLLAEQIAAGYTAIDPFLENLCQKSCVHCQDICCSRATVWYDFRDILFFYYHTGKFPPQQVRLSPGGDCIHLAAGGCRLDRAERPFICSWYICPEQKKAVEHGMTGEGEQLLFRINRMKSVRKEMEQEFMRQLSLSSGRSN